MSALHIMLCFHEISIFRLYFKCDLRTSIILGRDVAFVKMTIILHKYQEVCNIVDGLINVLIDQI